MHPCRGRTLSPAWTARAVWHRSRCRNPSDSVSAACQSARRAAASRKIVLSCFVSAYVLLKDHTHQTVPCGVHLKRPLGQMPADHGCGSSQRVRSFAQEAVLRLFRDDLRTASRASDRLRRHLGLGWALAGCLHCRQALCWLLARVQQAETAEQNQRRGRRRLCADRKKRDCDACHSVCAGRTGSRWPAVVMPRPWSSSDAV